MVPQPGAARATIPNNSPSSAIPKRGQWRGAGEGTPYYVGHTLDEPAAESQRGFGPPEPRARSLGVGRPLSRPAIEIGFGLGKDRGRRRRGIRLPNPKAQSFAPPEGEGERRCGGSGCELQPLAPGPLRTAPLPTCALTALLPLLAPPPLPASLSASSIPTPCAPPSLPLPAFLLFLHRLVRRAQPRTLTLPHINKRGC